MIRVTQAFNKEKDQVNTSLEIEGNALIEKLKLIEKSEYLVRNSIPTKLKAKAYYKFNTAYIEIKELIEKDLEPRLESGEYLFSFAEIISKETKDLFKETCSINGHYCVVGDEEWGLDQAKIDLTEELYSYLYSMDDILDLLID